MKDLTSFTVFGKGHCLIPFSLVGPFLFVLGIGPFLGSQFGRLQICISLLWDEDPVPSSVVVLLLFVVCQFLNLVMILVGHPYRLLTIPQQSCLWTIHSWIIGRLQGSCKDQRTSQLVWIVLCEWWMLLSIGLHLWFICCYSPIIHWTLWKWLSFLPCRWGLILMVKDMHLWWYGCWHICNLGRV